MAPKSVKKLRILLVSDMYWPTINGAIYFTYRLSQALAAAGHTVGILVPSPSGKTETYKEGEVTIYGIASFALPIKSRLRVSPQVFVSRQIRRVIAEFQPDCLHVQNHFLIGAATIREARRQKLPIIGTNHFMPENVTPYLHLPRPLEQYVVDLAWHHFDLMYRHLDVVTTPTKSAVKLLKDHGFSGHAIAISCGIDTERFQPTRNQAAIRKRFNLPLDQLVVLMVSRLDPEKNIETIVRALGGLPKNLPITLAIAGTGEERERLGALAKQLGITKQVRFLGFVNDDDLPSLYQAADVFVAAGIAELQCLSAMEAMASGLPILAADAVALPELVKSGQNGWLFPPHDIEAVKQALLKFIEKPEQRLKMGKTSRRLIQAHSIAATVKAFEKLYRQAIKNKVKRV